MRLRDLWPGSRGTADKTGRFGYAVVGLGHIADYFLDALRTSSTCAVTALVSGDAAKARKKVAKYNVPLVLAYSEFDRLLEHPEVDAVYLALPVSMHREFTERAAALGKHVLCEKPMAANAPEARAMVAACRAAGVLLSIAYRCPHHPQYRYLRSLLQAGTLGAPETIRIYSGFGFELSPGWRDSPALAGGGSLFDVGIYPLNTARFLLGEDPVRVDEASAKVDPNGLERSIHWTSIFPSGAQLRGWSSYVENVPDMVKITGANGNLLMAPAFSHRERYHLRGQYRAGETDKMKDIDIRTPGDVPSEFRLEAEALAAAVVKKEPLPTPGEDGLADMVAIEAIYAAAGVRLP